MSTYFYWMLNIVYVTLLNIWIYLPLVSVNFWFDRQLRGLRSSLIILRLILSFLRVDLIWPYCISRVFTEFPRCLTRYRHSGWLELKYELYLPYVRCRTSSAKPPWSCSFLDLTEFRYLHVWLSIQPKTQANFCAHSGVLHSSLFLCYLSLQPLACQSPQLLISVFSTQWSPHALFPWVQFNNCLQTKSWNNHTVHFICSPSVRNHNLLLPIFNIWKVLLHIFYAGLFLFFTVWGPFQYHLFCHDYELGWPDVPC